MHPLIHGYPAIFVFWGAAIALGIIGAAILARRDGFPAATSWTLVVMLGLIFLLGTKIHAWLVTPSELWMGSVSSVLFRGFHFPGGVILTGVLAPLLFWLLGVPILRFLDSIVPVVGLAIALARIGCFLNGCCYGVACDWPWGVQFPIGSRAFSSLFELQHSHYLASDGLSTIALHPLSLYFSLAGLGLFAVTLWLRGRKSYDGQLVLWFVVLWAWSKVAIESLRDSSMMPITPHLFGIGVGLAIASTVVLIVVTLRRSRGDGASVPSVRST